MPSTSVNEGRSPPVTRLANAMTSATPIRSTSDPLAPLSLRASAPLPLTGPAFRAIDAPDGGSSPIGTKSPSTAIVATSQWTLSRARPIDTCGCQPSAGGDDGMRSVMPGSAGNLADTTATTASRCVVAHASTWARVTRGGVASASEIRSVMSRCSA